MNDPNAMMHYLLNGRIETQKKQHLKVLQAQNEESALKAVANAEA